MNTTQSRERAITPTAEATWSKLATGHGLSMSDHQWVGACLAPGVRPFAIALLVLCLALVDANAAEHSTGLRNSSGAHSLNERQLRLLQESLRHKSGFMELGFDREGLLTLGDRRRVRSGSHTARTLLIAAVDGRDLYELESSSRSAEIAFAQLHESGIHEDETGNRMNISQVHIDFADFDRLEGAREARAALDVGFALLHELVHGVLKLRDPKDEVDQIGDCDAHVNQMRRELFLPERLYYNPDISVRQFSGRYVVTASLEFVERNSEGKPRAKHRLYYLPSAVSPAAKNVPQLQAGTMAAIRR